MFRGRFPQMKVSYFTAFKSKRGTFPPFHARTARPYQSIFNLRSNYTTLDAAPSLFGRPRSISRLCAALPEEEASPRAGNCWCRA